jgi:hypothetical protein
MAAELVFPQGVTRLSIQERVPAEEYGRILSNVLGLMQTQGLGQEYVEDITEYLSYITRAEQRLKQLPQS